MTQTTIHVTKKLEKQVKKLISGGEVDKVSPLGKWNANLFYIHRKKCWLVTNKLTQYHLLLADIDARKLKDIDRIFKDELYEQLIHDGIVFPHDRLDALIGTLAFYPTDNDRQMNGFQNQRLFELEWHIYDYPNLDEMPIREFNSRMNRQIIHLDKNRRRSSDYTYARNNIKKLLEPLV